MLKSITTAVIAIVIVMANLLMLGSLNERIEQLEEEVQGLKLLMPPQSAPTGSVNNRQKSNTSIDGWKNLANWRTLKNGMSYDNVRQALGEPARVQGGVVTFWFYPNQGSVIFRNDKLNSWFEPK